MKKSSILILASLALLSLSACGQKKEDTTSSSKFMDHRTEEMSSSSMSSSTSKEKVSSQANTEYQARANSSKNTPQKNTPKQSMSQSVQTNKNTASQKVIKQDNASKQENRAEQNIQSASTKQYAQNLSQNAGVSPAVLAALAYQAQEAEIQKEEGKGSNIDWSQVSMKPSKEGYVIGTSNNQQTIYFENKEWIGINPTDAINMMGYNGYKPKDLVKQYYHSPDQKKKINQFIQKQGLK